MYLSHKCLHCHSFQTVNCKIVGRMQSLMATVMKLAYRTLAYYVLHIKQ